MSYVQDELMVSGSDDFKLLLWNPSKDKKSIGKTHALKKYDQFALKY